MLILAVSYLGLSFTSIYLLYLCVCTFHHGYTWLCPCSSHLTFYPPLSPCAIRLSISPHWNYPDYDYSHDDNDNHCKIALSFSHIQHPGDYDWLKGCLQIILFFFQLHSISLCFLHFIIIIIWLFHTFLTLCTHCSLPRLLTFCLQSFSIYMAVFHLYCCAPFNLHLTFATCPLHPLLMVFSHLFVLSSLSPLFSSNTCIFFFYKETRSI